MTVTEESIGGVIENGCNSNAVVETDDVVDDLAEEIELMSIDRVTIFSICIIYLLYTK